MMGLAEKCVGLEQGEVSSSVQQPRGTQDSILPEIQEEETLDRSSQCPPGSQAWVKRERWHVEIPQRVCSN